MESDGDVGGFYRDDLEGRTPLLPDRTPDPYGPRKRPPFEFLRSFDAIVADMNAQWLAIDMLHDGYYGA